MRREAGLPVASAWGIDTPQLAERVVAKQQMDLVMVGRAHLADPHWPYYAAKQLGVERPSWTLPAPYAHWLERYKVAAKAARAVVRSRRPCASPGAMRGADRRNRRAHGTAAACDIRIRRRRR